jgi:4-amino-4-deoxy-L-arabinose transferase-like glycosyltransferase
MDFSAPHIAVYIRVVAVISLLLGLNDAARLLGVNMGSTSPIAALGMSGFVYLAIFALARLFAAVGLWIKASWGAVLLVGVTVFELGLYLLGNPDVRISAFAFAVRVVLLAAIVVIFVLSVRFSRARTAD